MAFKNLLYILFPERFQEYVNHATISDETPHAQHCEENVQAMCELMENRELVNVFSGQIATPKQSVDMMQF